MVPSCKKYIFFQFIFSLQLSNINAIKCPIASFVVLEWNSCGIDIVWCLNCLRLYLELGFIAACGVLVKYIYVPGLCGTEDSLVLEPSKLLWLFLTPIIIITDTFCCCWKKKYWYAFFFLLHFVTWFPHSYWVTLICHCLGNKIAICCLGNQIIQNCGTN